MSPISPKQKQVLDFIGSFASKNGYAPSQKEIAKHFGFKSLGTVQNYLVRLEREGVLQKTWNAKRSLAIVSDPTPQERTVPTPLSDSLRELPLVGLVAAGRPIEAVERPDVVDVPSSMLGQGDHFVLRVQGDSMIGEGILDGDFVVIKKQSVAQNGQTVVALLKNEATIKKFYEHKGMIELRAANPAYSPIKVPVQLPSQGAGEDSFRIEGVMVGLIRKM